MFIMYLFALSKAAFGEGGTAGGGIPPRLTNPEKLQHMATLPHRCKLSREVHQHKILVLVSREGFVTDYRYDHCQDHVFEKALNQAVKKLSFIPAISEEGLPIPATVEVSYEGHIHL